MRLWSIHPQYLDASGLVALWREGLLAQAVLVGRTRGYTRHPQLIRFRDHADPEAAIGVYLHAVADEAAARGYSFDRSKLPAAVAASPVDVTEGQLLFEWKHLLKKLRLRHPFRYRQWKRLAMPEPHPFFRVVPGPVEGWEKGSSGMLRASRARRS